MVQEKMTREPPFSYNCLRCNECCHGKLIQVNPYEILKIANRLEISTSEVLSTYIMTDQPYLRQVENAACIFLGKDGCQIHSHRPTVCRIYPLGRFKDGENREFFINAKSEMGGKDLGGVVSNIQDYIDDQRVQKYFDAGLKCLELQHRIVEAFHGGRSITIPPELEKNLLDWLDVDKVLALVGAEIPNKAIDQKLETYVAAIDQWLTTPNFSSGGSEDDC